MIINISVSSKIQTNISFIKVSCFLAGIALIPIFIMAYEDPLNLMVVSFTVPVRAVLGGLTNYILQNYRKTKVYLVQENEWNIAND